MPVRVLGVSLHHRGGGLAWAPRHVIPGRGSHPNHGHWGPASPAPGTPLGAALFVPSRPRNRMGLSGSAWKHARHQRQRNVYRGARYAVGRRRFYRAAESLPNCQARLSREARRTRPRYGRGGGPLRTRKPEAVSRSSFITLSHQQLMATYTRVGPGYPGVACARA